MWTYASLEAESEGLVEHTTFPFSSPSTPPDTVHLSVLQPGWEGEKKVAGMSRRSPRMLRCPWTKMDHVPFGVRDRNRYCVLFWVSCVMVAFEFLFLFLFFLPFFFTPLLCKNGERMLTEKMSLFLIVCLLALSTQYVVKFPISNGERQHNKCTLSPFTEGHHCIVGWFKNSLAFTNPKGCFLIATG